MARRTSTPADQASSGDTRSRILQVAAQLFADKGIGATTVRDIGDRAGVHSGSLYHWFRSKDEIAAEILSGFLGDIHQRFVAVTRRASSPEAAIRGLIEATVAVIEDHPAPTAMYQQDRQYLREHGLLDRVDEASRGVRGYWMTAIRAGATRRHLPDRHPAGDLLSSIAGCTLVEHALAASVGLPAHRVRRTDRGVVPWRVPVAVIER